MKNGFIIYNTQYNPIKGLSLEQKGKLLDRIFLYNLGENIESGDAVIEMAFGFFKQQFEMDNKKYQETVVERNKINGSKGGRPKKEKETQENPKNPVGLKKADNDNDNVKDIILINNTKVLQKQSFGDNDINIILEKIKEKHKVIDGTIKDQRQYGKLLKDKLSKIQGFNGDYGGFISYLLDNVDEYKISLTTSPKSIYYNLGKLITNIKTKTNKSELINIT